MKIIEDVDREKVKEHLLATGNPPEQVDRMLSGKCNHVHYWDNGTKVYSLLKIVAANIINGKIKINLLECDNCHKYVLDITTPHDIQEAPETAEVRYNISLTDLEG